MEEQKMNRVAQAVGVAIGLVGVYWIVMLLPVLFEGFKSTQWSIWALIIVWLLIAGSLVLTGYGAIFRQTDSEIKSMSFIAALIVMVFADDIVEPLLARTIELNSPRQLDHLSSGLSFILAILTFQLLKRATRSRKVT